GLKRYAEFVQMMPASEAHHHAHVGGLLAHTLEMVLAALRWRIGRLLPHGASAETLDAKRDHWTYAVFYGALLHDIGKVMADLRVEWTQAGRSEALRWSPVTGSLVDVGADEYHVGFTPRSERNYAEHGRQGILLLQSIAPQFALSILGHDQQALQALMAFFSGDDRTGPVAEIVGLADQASTRHALAHGSRARFATAKARPLIELLMDALKDLLRAGGKLPLNRNGAVGWVCDGSIWFVAKRLADEVRAHLKQHAPEESVPGESKNDRLFDTWQEYGVIEGNPATRQAIWYVVVHGEDGEGYSHRLTMLRFPLEKVWDDPSQYPQVMSGRIEVLPGRDVAPSEDQAAAQAPVVESSEVPPKEAQQGPKNVAAKGTAGGVQAPRFAKKAKMEQEAASEVPTERVIEVEDDGEFLDQADTAVAESRRPRKSAPGVSADSPVPQPLPTASSNQPGPVALIPSLPPLPNSKPVPELATRFMHWLLTSLHTGTITFNQSSAPVHFVPAGMALVSPLIFREFAAQYPDLVTSAAPNRFGLDVQREVLKAGWHVPGPGGSNIHQFNVVKRGAKVGRLSAVVIADPKRFVVQVPPSNPAVVPVEEEGQH
ncbi:MAG TPA: MobH family relaxase, partial [Burkholderiaceae bacterium]|nr:MobH family relaxase [Burkholderiaceae bacterium]